MGDKEKLIFAAVLHCRLAVNSAAQHVPVAVCCRVLQCYLCTLSASVTECMGMQDDWSNPLCTSVLEAASTSCLCAAACKVRCRLPQSTFGHVQPCIYMHSTAALKKQDGWLQAVQDAAVVRGLSIKQFSPAVVRRALRQAGNILEADEVEEVLTYIIKDRQYSELDQLYVVLLRDASVQQLRCNLSPGTQQPPVQKQFFMWGDDESQALYNLMEGSGHQQVVDCTAWRQIAG